MDVDIPGLPGSPAIPGYAKLPAGATRGVVVVHELFGRKPEVDRVVDRFEAAGYAAVEPDLFAGGVGCVVRALRDVGTGRGEAFDKLSASRAWLAERAGIAPERVGIIGFCLGGGFALACGPGWPVASANYGIVPSVDVLRGGPPTIACYGNRDGSLKGASHKLRERLAAAGREGEVHLFENVGHSFLTDGPAPWWTTPYARFIGHGHGGPTADEAWSRIFQYFDRHLPL